MYFQKRKEIFFKIVFFCKLYIIIKIKLLTNDVYNHSDSSHIILIIK